MKKIRRSVFETNSSSTHSICIAKDVEINIPKTLHIAYDISSLKKGDKIMVDFPTKSNKVIVTGNNSNLHSINIRFCDKNLTMCDGVYSYNSDLFARRLNKWMITLK